MVKFKVKKPGEFREDNIHGGRMWGSMQEWREHRLSSDKIAKIVIACFEGGASESTLKLIRKTCSYLYNLETGIPGENWSIMPGVFKCIKLSLCTPSKGGVIPDHVPTAEQLRLAFTTEFREGCGMTFLFFLRAVLIAWDFFVLGNRPKVDLNKIKKSVVHKHDTERHICATKFPGGRSKLAGHKKGTRNWWALRICMCPDGKHVSPKPGLAFSFDRYGNTRMDVSKYCTTCPIFAFEVLELSQPTGQLKLYRNWLTSESRSRKGRSRWGDKSPEEPQLVAIEWLRIQGVSPISKNSGRKATADWSQKSGCPFHELVHIVGDNEDVWRKSYQPKLPPTNSKVREQSEDLVVATEALRRFRGFCGRNPPVVVPSGLSRSELGFYTLLNNLGFGQDAKKIFG